MHPEPPSERPGKREASGAAAADASGAAGTDAAVGTSLSDSNREVACMHVKSVSQTIVRYIRKGKVRSPHSFHKKSCEKNEL